MLDFRFISNVSTDDRADVFKMLVVERVWLLILWEGWEELLKTNLIYC